MNRALLILFLLAAALHESGWGTSSISRVKIAPEAPVAARVRVTRSVCGVACIQS